MPDKDPDVRIAIFHSIKVLSRWTVGLYLCVAVVLGLGVLQSKRLAEHVDAQADRTDQALCTFVGDLQARVKQAADYLQKHPGPEPFPGVSRADLRLAVKRQRATLRSLDKLRCS